MIPSRAGDEFRNRNDDEDLNRSDHGEERETDGIRGAANHDSLAARRDFRTLPREFDCGSLGPACDQNEFQIRFASFVSVVVLLPSLDHSGLS